MTIKRQDIDNKIKNDDLLGRSFTVGVAVYELVKGGAKLDRDIRLALAEALESLINADYDKIDMHLTDIALVEALDLAVIDEVVRYHYEYDE